MPLKDTTVNLQSVDHRLTTLAANSGSITHSEVPVVVVGAVRVSGESLIRVLAMLWTQHHEGWRPNVLRPMGHPRKGTRAGG
jgi:hypothetical protein